MNIKIFPLPFYVNLKNKREFLEVEFIHKKKTILLTYYVFYSPFLLRNKLSFQKYPK
ncbi:MAG: hypothetical protein ACK4F0_07555 [Candidatus Ratteibacteria bacterium]